MKICRENIIKLLGAWKSVYVIKGPPTLAPVGGNDSSFSGSWVGMGGETKQCTLDVLHTDRGLPLGML
jgi:hypothetical protein